MKYFHIKPGKYYWLGPTKTMKVKRPVLVLDRNGSRIIVEDRSGKISFENSDLFIKGFDPVKDLYSPSIGPLNRSWLESKLTYEEKELAKRKDEERKLKLERQKKLALERKNRKINILVGSGIRRRLGEMNVAQEDLAEALGVTTGAVSRYICGEMMPRKSYHEKLFQFLKLPYNTLEEFVEAQEK